MCNSSFAHVWCVTARKCVIDCEKDQKKSNRDGTPNLESIPSLDPREFPLRAPVALQIIDGFQRGSGVEHEQIPLSSVCVCLPSRYHRGFLIRTHTVCLWVSGFAASQRRCCRFCKLAPPAAARDEKKKTPLRPYRAAGRAQSSGPLCPSAGARLAGPPLKQAARQPQARGPGGG